MFLARHLAVVILMVIAGQMKHAVKHQYLDLGRQRMSKAFGVFCGNVRRNGDVSGASIGFNRMERQHVCRLVLATESAIQFAHLSVIREQHLNWPIQPNGTSRARSEARERLLGNAGQFFSRYHHVRKEKRGQSHPRVLLYLLFCDAFIVRTDFCIEQDLLHLASVPATLGTITAAHFTLGIEQVA